MERVDRRLLVFVPVWLISEMALGVLWPSVVIALMPVWVFFYGVLCAPYLERLWRIIARRNPNP